ncbi:hypothetical protein DYQ91_18835, partial [Xanthomonas sp. LMG 8989]|nr:hypothetical protein [Xanthomonas sp. LMG 8989]
NKPDRFRGYTGKRKTQSLEQALQGYPERVVEAVDTGMLPNGSLGCALYCTRKAASRAVRLPPPQHTSPRAWWAWTGSRPRGWGV